MTNFYKNRVYYLELAITDLDGNYVTSLQSGESVNYRIIKSSDGTEIDSGDMILDGNVWKAQYIFTTIGEYRIEYITPIGYQNGIDEILVLEESQSPEEQEYKLNRILGLCQENYRIFEPTFDKYGNMSKATIKTYSNATDCDNDENVLAEYEMTALFDRKNHMTDYKVKRII